MIEILKGVAFLSILTIISVILALRLLEKHGHKMG